jgi:dihydrofolate reductase
MRKIILIIHTSIDGFVAGKRGEFDDFNPSPENLDFICSLTDEADAALMGRVAYQMLQSFWPDARNKADASKSEIKYSNWFNDAQMIVLSNSMTGKDLNKTEIIMEIYQKKFFR